MSNPLPTDVESLSLTVTLAGRPYPLRVLPADEEPIRRIAKELNDKVVDFQRAYPGKDKQDCLAMLLLIYAVDLFKEKDGQAAAPRADALAPTLQRLERELSAALRRPGGPPSNGVDADADVDVSPGSDAGPDADAAYDDAEDFSDDDEDAFPEGRSR